MVVIDQNFVLLLRPLLLVINVFFYVSAVKKVFWLFLELFVLEDDVIVEFVVDLQLLLVGCLVDEAIAAAVDRVVRKDLVLDIFALNSEQSFERKKRVLLL